MTHHKWVNLPGVNPCIKQALSAAARPGGADGGARAASATLADPRRDHRGVSGDGATSCDQGVDQGVHWREEPHEG